MNRSYVSFSFVIVLLEFLHQSFVFVVMEGSDQLAVGSDMEVIREILKYP